MATRVAATVAAKGLSRSPMNMSYTPKGGTFTEPAQDGHMGEGEEASAGTYRGSTSSRADEVRVHRMPNQGHL